MARIQHDCAGPPTDSAARREAGNRVRSEEVGVAAGRRERAHPNRDDVNENVGGLRARGGESRA